MDHNKQERIFHIPVMVNEVINFLVWKRNGLFIDATVGGGGHAEKILESTFTECQLIGIDQDPEACEEARKRLSKFQNRFQIVWGNFADLQKLLPMEEIPRASGILFDLGISWFQLQNEKRGFSYNKDGPLDMRMNPTLKLTAQEVVNQYDEIKLYKIIKGYGEERRAKRIASNIVKRRKKNRIKTTLQLVKVIQECFKKPFINKALSRCFQAIRIEVNQELRALKEGLLQALEILEQNGKLVVISYHSLEDRIVKETFRFFENEGLGKILTKKPIFPRESEIKENHKARTARLRTFERN